MNFVCPLPTEIADIPVAGCPVKLDQLVKTFFQRKQSAEPVFVDAVNDITAAASWATFLAASDGTKATISPFFSGLAIPMSESISIGGNDNSTVFGLPEYQGEGNVTVEGMIKNVEQAIVKALKTYTVESFAQAGVAGLTIFPINRFGQIIARRDEADTGYSGIEIYNIRFSGRGSEGYNANDTVAMRFDLAEGWDEGLTVVTPADFDALTLTA